MSPDLQNALWGIAVLAPFALNVAVRRGPDAMGLSGMIVVGWAFERLCWALWSPPEAMQLYPIMDAMFGLTAYSAWVTRPAAWKLVLTTIFVAQCALHAAFWAGWPAASSLLIYLRANNIAFALELITVAYPGASHGVALLLEHCLPARAWNRDHAGP